MDTHDPHVADLTGTRWRKSRHSNGAEQCVEVAEPAADAVAARDSKLPDGGVLRFTAEPWNAFVRTTGAGGFRRA